MPLYAEAYASAYEAIAYGNHEPDACVIPLRELLQFMGGFMQEHHIPLLMHSDAWRSTLSGMVDGTAAALVKKTGSAKVAYFYQFFQPTFDEGYCLLEFLEGGRWKGGLTSPGGDPFSETPTAYVIEDSAYAAFSRLTNEVG